jgi:predicted ATPase with chaperone activity
VATAAARLRIAEPPVGAEAGTMLASALGAGLLTARGVHRVGRVATTLAALSGCDEVGEDHVAESMALRADW